MYARGILFGKMRYELGDHSYVRCPENHLVADIEFKTKGYFSGTYNAIGGTIKNEKTGEVLYELSGLWNGEMYLKDVHVCFDVPKLRTLGTNLTGYSHMRRKSYLMQHTRNTVLLRHVRWKSKVTGNRRNCGIPLSRLLLPGITKPPQTRRPRLKITNETKRPNAPTMV